MPGSWDVKVTFTIGMHGCTDAFDATERAMNMIQRQKPWAWGRVEIETRPTPEPDMEDDDDDE